VWPRNGKPLVDEWLTVTGLDPESEVEVSSQGSMTSMPLRDALTTTSEIAHISPDLLRFVQQRTSDANAAANSPR